MFNSQIIDVGIGLALMYLFQSILVSGINELIVAATSYRGKVLKRFLNLALKDKDEKNSLVDKLFSSPYIINLRKKGKYPPEITSRNFADAVFEMINRNDFSTAAVSEKIASNLKTLPDSNFKHILIIKFEEVNGNIELFKHSVEDWYNDYMNKVTHWYKSKMSGFILLFSFIITVAMNVDSFRVMNELWKNAKLRESVVSMSEDITKQEYQNYLATATATDSLDIALDKVSSNYQKLHMLDFPITWDYEYKIKNGNASTISKFSLWEKINWSYQQFTLEKILGFIITTMAVSIGAPIWFDILKKLVGMKQQVVKLKNTSDAK
jgi:hypothetical protein